MSMSNLSKTHTRQ